MQTNSHHNIACGGKSLQNNHCICAYPPLTQIYVTLTPGYAYATLTPGMHTPHSPRGMSAVGSARTLRAHGGHPPPTWRPRTADATPIASALLGIDLNTGPRGPRGVRGVGQSTGVFVFV